jgi:hypothetical protein
MKKIFLALLLVVVFAIPAFGGGTCVTTVKTSTTTNARIPDPGTVIVTLTCTAAADDSFPPTAIALAGATTSLNAYNLYGTHLYQVGRTPGSPAPSASYTVTITDAQGFAIDLGLLTTNGSTSAAQLTQIYTAGAGYPIIRSIPTVAITANTNTLAQITLDLIFKALAP